MLIDEGKTREIVSPLIISIRDLIKDLKENGTIQPTEALIRKWTVTNFSYDKSGISSFAQMGEVQKKSTWQFVSNGIFFKVMTLPQYGTVLYALSQLPSQKLQAPIYLQRFCNKIIQRFLETDPVIDSDIDDFVRIFFLDVNDQPVQIKIKLGLTGIILEPDEIQINPDYRLRKPIKEDFEREENVLFNFNAPNYPNPTAFLEINTNIENQEMITNAIEHSITIFRLYHSGMIRSTGYEINSSSIFYGLAGTVGFNDHSEIHDKYLITSSEIQNFIQFWKKISEKIPESFYRIGKNDFKTISYNRYSDALKYDSLIERRIATSIMGMESIFLKSGGENAELEFRLSLRITQLLKNMAYDPLSVKQVVNDAYEIRSAFLHGDVLPEKRERKIAARYGDSLNNLLQLTLDFLRVSVIISITLPNSKEEFVKTLDESLWNRELTDQLSREIGEGISIANLSKLEN
jgi:hypothetical protein